MAYNFTQDDLLDITAATGGLTETDKGDAAELTTEAWQALYGETYEEWASAKAADEAEREAWWKREDEMRTAWEAEHPDYDPLDDEII